MSADSNGAERVPPQAVEVEAAVLGAMLLDQDAISQVIDIIDDTDFYRDAHRKIFQAIISLFERNEPTDLITLTTELSNRKQLNDVGGAFYLAGLADNVSTAANAEYHANIVHEKAMSRKLITSSNQIIARAFDQSENPDDLLDEAEQMIFALSERRLKRGFSHLNPILHDTFENIERLHERSTGVTGVPTGELLDRLRTRGGWLVGTPGEVVEEMGRREQAGLTCLQLQHHSQENFEVLELIASEVLPQVQD